MKINSVVKLEQKYKDFVQNQVNKGKDLANPQYYQDFINNSFFIYLGEIDRMEGHGIFVGRDGKVYWGFHIEDFCEVDEDEL